ncbi:unnamed protein product [Auanema sp. JU1783]|nr:unnamed protein product [Auanema sp. JU1783]
MNFEFLRTLQGFLNLLQVCLGFAALFACSFIWTAGNLYFQFIFSGFGWQTLILIILFVTWVFALLIFLSNLFEKDVLGQLGKAKLIILYGICLVALIIAASLETWYSTKFTRESFLKSRFIAVTVFSWLLVASYAALMLLTAFFV